MRNAPAVANIFLGCTAYRYGTNSSGFQRDEYPILDSRFEVRLCRVEGDRPEPSRNRRATAMLRMRTSPLLTVFLGQAGDARSVKAWICWKLGGGLTEPVA